MLSMVLSRKQWLITAALISLWTLFMVFVAVFSARNEHEQVNAYLIEQSRTTYWVVLLSWGWALDIGHLYTPVTDRIIPDQYISTPDRDVVTTRGQHLTRITPANMTKFIGSYSMEDALIDIRMTSTNPINPMNTPDSWESASLIQFEKGKSETFTGIMKERDRYTFRYMAPLFMEQSCLECHGNQGYTEGMIRGGLSVIMDANPAYVLMEREIIRQSVVTVLVWMFGLGGIILLMNNIAGRLREELHTEKFRGVLEMAGAAAHEMNQPLQIISGYAELIPIIEPEDHTSMKTMLETIRKNIARLAVVTWKLNNITCYETRNYVGNSKIVDIYKSAPDSTPDTASSSDRYTEPV
jgi:two-component system, NtrC family, sensor kinase